ncbi:class II fumarate hydratase [Thiorhodococcus fuscus]|uniref:fumarate hydratase n=1 Tax=Thiorhodococcus fuscus TaxID=527200 RepID=A0ABW4Y3X1_9GAMM
MNTPDAAKAEDQPLYGKQTRLAVENFRIGGRPLPGAFIRALGLIKATAARVNGALEALPTDMAEAIAEAADAVAEGRHQDQFPVDVFQTGSGTSTNMNANEVIATLAERRLGRPVHPNDDVNRGQSSNDVIPTAIHVSAALALRALTGHLDSLQRAIEGRARTLDSVVKTGRTHLMDAVPITLGQELSGWAAQIAADIERLNDVERRLLRLAQGGTAVGSGLNSHPEFAERFASLLAARTGLAFQPAPNAFAVISAQDTAVELSGQLRVTAISLLKIATDLRWMNSGPVAGLAEIRLPELQPGSSIMPGKVNPVIPEAVSMACTQVIGLDAAIALAGQNNRFQLATMLPLIALDLLEQIRLLSGSAEALETQTIARFEVDAESLGKRVRSNAMLATALTPRIGYDRAVEIARAVQAQGREVIEVAREMTDLSEHDLKRLLDPIRMTHPEDVE